MGQSRKAPAPAPAVEDNGETTQLQFLIAPVLKAEFKVYAVRHGTTMSDLLIAHIRDLLARGD